jgi:hypothetical protein
MAGKMKSKIPGINHNINVFVPVFVLLFVAVSTIAACAGDRDKMRFGFSQDLVPGRDFVPRQLIVGHQPDGKETVIQEAAKFGGEVNSEMKGEVLFFQFSSEDQVLAAAQALSALPLVIYVERNGIIRIPPVIERNPGRLPQ